MPEAKEAPPRAPGRTRGGGRAGTGRPERPTKHRAHIGPGHEPGARCLGGLGSVEISAPSDDAGSMVLREPRRHSARLGSIFGQARKTLDSLEREFAKEERSWAEE